VDSGIWKSIVFLGRKTGFLQNFRSADFRISSMDAGRSSVLYAEWMIRQRLSAKP
jgi:hypothetical protein